MLLPPQSSMSKAASSLFGIGARSQFIIQIQSIERHSRSRHGEHHPTPGWTSILILRAARNRDVTESMANITQRRQAERIQHFSVKLYKISNTRLTLTKPVLFIGVCGLDLGRVSLDLMWDSSCPGGKEWWELPGPPLPSLLSRRMCPFTHLAHPNREELSVTKSPGDFVQFELETLVWWFTDATSSRIKFSPSRIDGHLTISQLARHSLTLGLLQQGKCDTAFLVFYVWSSTHSLYHMTLYINVVIVIEHPQCSEGQQQFHLHYCVVSSLARSIGRRRRVVCEDP